MAIIKRTITKNILEALRFMPVVFVNGPRQAGKSTLVKMLSEKAWPANYVTFDEASQLGAAQANPEFFLRSQSAPQPMSQRGTQTKSQAKGLIIDEVQMVPDLFRVLKMIVDQWRLDKKGEANGRFLLTGSANILALPALADALVGRMSIITLYPLSALEIAKGKGNFLKKLFAAEFSAQTHKHQDYDLIDVMQRATFPEITDQPDNHRRKWFEGYTMTILQRDLRQIANVEKLAILPNLLKILANRAGGLINDADIARAIGQNAVTSKHYRLLLQMMFLTFDISPYSRNIGKRLVKSPKGYLIDTAFLSYLLQINLKNVALRDAQMFGHLLENFVATELLKHLGGLGEQTNLMHFRTSDGKEVDFVLEKFNGLLAGIEVKTRERVSSDDFKGLRELQAQTGKDFACGVVLYHGKHTIPFGERLWAVPVNALWN
jgi:uncharacterized protein